MTVYNSPGRPANGWSQIICHPAFVPGCIALGLFIRIFVAIALPTEPYSDAAWYLNRAQELAAGMGYQESGHPTAYWPIGWPAILAAGLAVFKSAPFTILLLNSIAAAAIMWFVVLFGRLATGKEFVARLALLAYALYPNHIAYHGTANTETVYLAIFMAAFLLLVKGRSRLLMVVASGVLFGIATLIKAQTLAFPFGALIALGLIYKDYSWLSAIRTGFILYIVLLLVVLPWSIRNKEVFGEFILVSTNGGFALLIGANDQVTGGHFEYQHTPVFKQFGIPWESRVKRQVELDNMQKEAAKSWIAENTYSWLAWMPRKFFRLWLKDTDGFWAYDRSYPDATGIVRAAQAVNQAFYMLVLLLSLYTVYVAGKALVLREYHLTPLGLLFCMPIFVSLLAAVFTGQIRYHHAAMPFLILSAAWVFHNLLLSDDKYKVGY